MAKKKSSLSKRQSQCLHYLLLGKSGVAIAEILGLSPKTVEQYVDDIKTKLGCNSKAELIEKVLESHYIH